MFHVKMDSDPAFWAGVFQRFRQPWYVTVDSDPSVDFRFAPGIVFTALAGTFNIADNLGTSEIPPTSLICTHKL